MKQHNERQSKFSGTKEVQDHLKLNEPALISWMNENVPDFKGPLSLSEFKGGQSNPTYKIQTETASYVLRRKPPGELLPSAHAVDREFQVIDALHRQNFPVPKPYALCTDPDVLGTMFYVMEKVEGRIFWELSLPELNPTERSEIYDSQLKTLTDLQAIDFEKAGLQGFGKTNDYMARQIHRWTKIYIASETSQIDAMDKLNTWLPNNLPSSAGTCIIHGDYRLDNIIIDPKKSQVSAVLDWELSTLGDPLADFVYHLAPWFLPVTKEVSSLKGLNLNDLGIPEEEDYINRYCELTGRDSIDNLEFYKAYTLWRIAAIYQGIIKRALDGTAASEDAIKNTDIVEIFAKKAWEFAQAC